MKRRNAIKGVLIGLGAVTGFAGYKWYDWNKPPDLAFLDSQEKLLDAIAGVIIPDTDTPGALNTGTGKYIITMIRDCTPKRGQNRFIDGLKELADFTRTHFNASFDACTPDQQVKTLKTFESQGRALPGIAGKAQVKFIGKSFFDMLKENTVKGYCTSKTGATKGLAYLPVPGRYNGAIALQQGQKSWATK